MAARVIVISAVHLPSTAGTLVSGERRIDEAGNYSGPLTAGPYVLLPPGPYEVDIEYSLDAPDGAPDCTFELSSHRSGGVVFSGAILAATAGRVRKTGVRFDLTTEGRIGVRTYFSGCGSLAIRSVTFRSLEDNRDPLDFGVLRRLRPFSDSWGFDRGVPVDRYYISEFMAENCADIRDHVVEVGDRHYTKRFGGGRVTVSDVLMPRQDRSVTIEADLRNAPHVADGSFDCVIATQVLECIDEFHLATSTIHRILKPGGVALVTLPSIQRLDNPHEWPLLWGFSDGAARFMFEKQFGERNSAVRAYGNILSATAFLYGLSAHELTDAELNHTDPDYQVIVGVRARKPDAS